MTPWFKLTLYLTTWSRGSANIDKNKLTHNHIDTNGSQKALVSKLAKQSISLYFGMEQRMRKIYALKFWESGKHFRLSGVVFCGGFESINSAEAALKFAI